MYKSIEQTEDFYLPGWYILLSKELDVEKIIKKFNYINGRLKETSNEKIKKNIKMKLNKITSVSTYCMEVNSDCG